jgi:adenylate kinase family enzyme
MKKVIIIGCPGSGKSTFARKLSATTSLSLYHLDLIWHKPDKTTISKLEFDQRLAEIIAQDAWIIDGNFQRTIETRIKAADTVCLLDFPIEVCVDGARSRVGTERPDMPWVEKELDPDFEKLILQFKETKLPRIYELLANYSDNKTIHIFKSREEVNAFIEQIGGGEYDA